MPPAEIGRAILQSALARTTATTSGALFVGMKAAGDIGASNLATWLEALKTQVDAKAASTDPRFTDARAPTAHGHSGADITSGTVSVDRIGTGTKDATTVYYGDGTFKAAPSGGSASSPASIDGVSNNGGNIDLVPGTNITITPDDAANTITITSPDKAPASIDGVSNAGGNIDLVAGANMTITPDDAANTITFAASGSGGSGSPYWKDAARVVTETNITLSGTQTIDGVALAAGERVGVLAQNNPADNGLYVVAAGGWSRSTDANSPALLDPGFAFSVKEGKKYGGSSFVSTTVAPITLGNTAITFRQREGGPSAAGKVCSIRRSAPLSVNNATWTVASWDFEESDPLNMFDPASNQVITIAEDGDYQLNASSYWASNTTGVRHLVISRNATNTDGVGFQLAAAPVSSASVSAVAPQSASAIATLKKGDTIRAHIYQNSGGTLSFGPANYETATRLSVTKLESSSGASAGIEPAAVGSFYAHQTAGQALTVSWQRINFQAEDRDVSGWFEPGTGATQSRFTPKKEGFYRLSASIFNNAATSLYTAIRKNESVSYRLGSTNVQSFSAGGSVLVYANGTTDFFDVLAYSGATQTTVASISTDHYTHFSGEYVGSLAGGGGPDPFATRYADLGKDNIIEGLNPALPGATLSLAIPAGTAIVMGRRIPIPAQAARAYTANQTTHVEVSEAGVFNYTTATPVTAGHLRLFSVVATTQITAINPVARRRDGGEEWTAVTGYINGFENYTGTTYEPGGYRKTGDGTVHLKGLLDAGTSNVTAFTLPAGYRPAKITLIDTVGHNGTAYILVRMIINPDGTVVFEPGPGNAAGTWITIESCTFRAAP